MRFTSARPTAFGGAPGGLRITPWVKRLLIANAAVFLVTVAVGYGLMADLFAFSPDRLLTRPWGMLTYMFVHAGLWHLLINLLFIFFFGPPLESRWGSDLFIKFYLICGLGGVLLSFVFSGASIVGASAACYGILLAFAMIWPNATVYIWGLVPVKVKWLVIFMVALSFASAIGPTRDGVAHLAHLGGAVAGFLLLQSGLMPGSGRSSAAPADWGPGAQAAGRGRPTGRGWGRAFSRGSGRASARGSGRASSRGSRRAVPGRPGQRRGFKFGDLWRRKEGPRASGKAKPRSESPRVIEVFDRQSAEKRAARESAELDRVDAVLDKISSEGINSLTPEERELLDRVSRQTRAN